jgi:phage shock protein C
MSAMLHSTTEYPSAGRQPAPRLHRCASDCVLFGVCSGIAEYLSIDPSLVRIAFVVAALCGGIGVLAYIVLAVVLPVSQKHGLGTLAQLESVLARQPDSHRSESVAAQPAWQRRPVSRPRRNYVSPSAQAAAASG